MPKNIQSVRGMNDCLPKETIIWQRVENTLKKVLTNYGYTEIRFPIIEKTALFKRVIGEVTEVVEKEMYSFESQNGDSLSLRPEGTAGCVRAAIEHDLLYSYEQRLWYIGPMFRYERPQKGRYRQFNQLGIEVFGLRGPSIDAELIMLATRWWRELNISDDVSLEINSIGSLAVRIKYCNDLLTFLKQHEEKLDKDCRRRMHRNPLRILDSKDSNVQSMLNDAPSLQDYLDNESRQHFSDLCKLLEVIGIPYTINHRLVRGLDYYNHTVFEWVTSRLGSQGAICAGGRYDGLVKRLGGRDIPAVGLAIGLDRLILLLQAGGDSKCRAGDSIIDVYLVTSGINIQHKAIQLAEQIRNELPNIKLMTNHDGSSFKKQFIRANRYGARIALILGNSEVSHGDIVIKDLRSGKQIKIMQKSIVEYLRTLLNEKENDNYDLQSYN